MTSRARRAAAAAAATACLLATAGCASGEEQVPLGADGSGSFRTEDRLSATLKDAGGTAVGRVQADAADGPDGLRLRVQVSGLEPGSYDVRLVPGAECADSARAGRGGRADTTGVPRLEVRSSGSGSVAGSATGVGVDDVEDGAAVVLVGDGPVACGVLASY